MITQGFFIASCFILAVLLNLGNQVQGKQFHRQSNDFQCREEGFQADPNNCNIYYRCVNWGNNSPLTKFKFECGPGTVFSNGKGNICVHPRESERPQCSESANDLDSSVFYQQPNRQTTPPTSWGYGSPLPDTSSRPMSSSSNSYLESSTRRLYTTTGYHQSTSNNYPSNNYPPNNYPSNNYPSNNYPSNNNPSNNYPSNNNPSSNHPQNQSPGSSGSNAQCQKEGFMPDPKDCSKFIRCVSNGNSYQRYEFTCGEGTVWDPSIDSCNHAWAVQRAGCGGSQSNDGSNNSNSGTNQGNSYEEPGNNQNGYPGSEESQSSTEGNQGPNDNSQSGYPGSQGSQENGNQGSSGENQGPDDGGNNQENGYGEPGNDGNGYPVNGGSQENENQRPSNDNNETSQSSGQGESNEVPRPPGGLYPMPGEPQEPSSERPSDSTTTSQSNYPLQPSYPSEPSEPPYGGPNYPTQSPEPSQPSGGSNYPSKPSQPSQPTGTPGVCSEEGFFPDTDCHKFIRCVSDGSNGFTKYSFSCGEGTAWDQSLQTCNYENSVSGCGTGVGSGSNESSNEIDSSTSDNPQSTSEEQPTSSTSKTPESSSSTTVEISPTESTTTSDGSNENKTTDETPSLTTELNPDSSSTTQQAESSSESATSTEESSESTTKKLDDSVTSSSPPEGSTEENQVSTTQQDISLTTDKVTTESQESGESTKPSEKPLPSGNSGKCEEEGFHPNPSDCKKFIRCVRVNDGFIKYDFDCGPGTAWDQSLLTCNYIDQVKSCGSGASSPGSGEQKPGQPNGESTTESTEGDKDNSSESSPSSPDPNSTEKEPSTTSTLEENTTEADTSSSTSSSTEQITTESGNLPSESPGNATGSDCSTPKPNNKIVCNEAGFYGNPTNCAKFYRCVDNGNGFNVYHFDCPPGTIFDPSISVCNYPESVYPARDCSGGGSRPAKIPPPSTTESSSQTTEAEKVTETGEATTELSETTTEGDSANQTTEATTDVGAETETQGPTTEGVTEASGETTTSADGLSTDQPTNLPTDQTTEQPMDQTTVQSTDQTTEQPTDQTTTQSSEETTPMETSTENQVTSEPGIATPCPIGNLTDEQIVLVCPTGFRRHPKYCNMLYQCTSEGNMEIKILILGCPDNTIFDEKKVQCLPESETEQKCDSAVASSRFYRGLENTAVAPVRVTRESLCPEEGHFPFKKGCSNAFYKCKRDSRNSLQGYLYKCPKDFVYWSVSRRCERASRLPMCSSTENKNSERLHKWESNGQLPLEDFNVSARMLNI